MTTENVGGQSAGDKIVAGVDEAATVIGTLVPTVAALSSLVRLIATAVRPSEAQKAQQFDSAIAELDAANGQLQTAVAGFEAAKQEAAAKQAVKVSAEKLAAKAGKPVAAMGTGPASKPSDA